MDSETKAAIKHERDMRMQALKYEAEMRDLLSQRLDRMKKMDRMKEIGLIIAGFLVASTPEYIPLIKELIKF